MNHLHDSLRSTVYLFLMLTLVAPISVTAGTITFDSTPPSSQTSLTTQGFTFSSIGFSIVNDSGSQGYIANPGSTNHLVEFGLITLTLTAQGGLPFSLNSLQYSGAYIPGTFIGPFDSAGENAATITLTGQVFGGGTVQSIIAPTTSFNTLTLPSAWSNLSSVTFDATGQPFPGCRTSACGGFALDNINASAVPEPGSLALVSGAVFALIRRTRKSR